MVDTIQQLMVDHGMPDGEAEIKVGSLARAGDSAMQTSRGYEKNTWTSRER